MRPDHEEIRRLGMILPRMPLLLQQMRAGLVPWVPRFNDYDRLRNGFHNEAQEQAWLNVVRYGEDENGDEW